MVARARGATLRIVAVVLAAGLLWLSAEIATGLTGHHTDLRLRQPVDAELLDQQFGGGWIDVNWCLLSASRSR